jgi:hypothetical protein
MFNADVIALDLLRANGIDPEAPVSAALLAYCVVGPSNIVRVPGLVPRARWNGRLERIEIRAGLPVVAESFLLAHEVAHRTLKHTLHWHEHIELEADALAAALLVPAPALRWAVSRHGRDLALLAELFTTTQSIVHLRLGEVFSSPLALVTPRRVHVRGEIEWGDEDDLRARAMGKKPVEPWFQLVPITDAPRRRGLVLL